MTDHSSPTALRTSDSRWNITLCRFRSRTSGVLSLILIIPYFVEDANHEFAKSLADKGEDTLRGPVLIPRMDLHPTLPDLVFILTNPVGMARRKMKFDPRPQNEALAGNG